jgi:hypothetical protein
MWYAFRVPLATTRNKKNDKRHDNLFSAGRKRDNSMSDDLRAKLIYRSQLLWRLYLRRDRDERFFFSHLYDDLCGLFSPGLS